MRWAVRSGPPPRGHASSRRPLIRPKTGKRRHGGPQNCGPPVVLALRGKQQSCEILDGMYAGRWREGKVVEWLFGLDSKEAALEAVESRD